MYSIENYLVEEAALVKLILEERPRLRATAVQNTLDMGTFDANNAELLRRLSALYVLAQRFDTGLENSKEAIERRTVKSDRWRLCSTKVSDFQNALLSRLRAQGRVADQHGMEALVVEQSDRMRIPADVPGKQLVALVRHYLQHKFGIHSITNDSFCFRLAKNCDFYSLASLRAKLL